MTREEMLQHVRRRPFEQFRIHLKDGRSFDIFDPNLALAAEGLLVIGIPAPEDPEKWCADRQVWVKWSEVERVEPLAQPAAPTV